MLIEQRKIEKFKILKVGIKVQWINGDDRLCLECADAPEPELPEALNALRDWAEELMDLPTGYLHAAAVTGISLDYGEKCVGLVATIQRPLKNVDAPLVLNTPRVTSETGPWPKEIDAATDRALRYLDGHRAQGLLDLGGETDADE